MMTSNRPLEDWGKLIGDVPAATAILDRFLHHAEIVTIAGKSYRLRNQSVSSKPAKAPTGSKKDNGRSKSAKAPTGSSAEEGQGSVKGQPAKKRGKGPYKRVTKTGRAKK